MDDVDRAVLTMDRAVADATDAPAPTLRSDRADGCGHVHARRKQYAQKRRSNHKPRWRMELRVCNSDGQIITRRERGEGME